LKATQSGERSACWQSRAAATRPHWTRSSRLHGCGIGRRTSALGSSFTGDAIHSNGRLRWRGGLNDEQRAQLTQAARAWPVGKTLSLSATIRPLLNFQSGLSALRRTTTTTCATCRSQKRLRLESIEILSESHSVVVLGVVDAHGINSIASNHWRTELRRPI